MNLSLLQQIPPVIEQSTVVIADLDACLLLGFARLGPAQHAALESLVATFTGTPLQNPISEASAAIKRSEFLTKHFCAFAAVRAAIQAAQYELLLGKANEALGRSAPNVDTDLAKPISPEGRHIALLSSTQQWLMELALAGFNNLSMETLSPFMATLEQMQAEPKLARIASLLTGFLTELLASTPAKGNEIPVYRWADLWTRAMIMAQQLPPLEVGATVNGTFSPLGADVRAHAHFASVVIYGLLERGKERRLVRVPLSSYKVDVIANMELWHLFRPAADPILEALASQKSLQITGMQLLSGGDLLWTGKAKLGGAFDPIAVGKLASSSDVSAPPPQPPLARHPVQLAELICIENCSTRKGSGPSTPELVADGQVLPLASERLPSGSEFDSKTLESANALVGLLRFDSGRWAVQPLCVRSKAGKKELVAAAGSGALAFCKKDKLKTLATLSERASKLLRQ